MTLEQTEYRNLIEDLGRWAEVFDLRPEDEPTVTLRGATGNSTFTAGDVAVFRFGRSIVVQRTLPRGGDAYFVVRPTPGGPQLVRRGVIARDMPGSLLDSMTDSLSRAATRARSAA